MNAAEHFEWARERAMEYVDLGDGEVMLAGAEGARRFIAGIPTPHVPEDAAP